MDYWKEAVCAALEEAGLAASDEQIELMKDVISGAQENYGMAMGYDVASANMSASISREQDEIKQRLKYEQEVPRNRCTGCHGHGFWKDGWGRDFGCQQCSGKGNIPIYQFQYSPKGK